MTRLLCECGCGGLAPIAPRSRTSNGDVKGQPVRFIAGHQSRSPVAPRFWGKVNKLGPIHPTLKTRCWVWVAGRTDTHNASHSYGQFYFEGKNHNAHRIAWLLTYGEWPTPCCLHHCDNPACVRPGHLFEGTNLDNVADREAKGRNNTPRGEDSVLAKLTTRQVVEIRARVTKGESRLSLSPIFKVSDSTIRNVVSGKRYKNVPNPQEGINPWHV